MLKVKETGMSKWDDVLSKRDDVESKKDDVESKRASQGQTNIGESQSRANIGQAQGHVVKRSSTVVGGFGGTAYSPPGSWSYARQTHEVGPNGVVL